MTRTFIDAGVMIVTARGERAIAVEITKQGMKTKKVHKWYLCTIKAILDNDLHTDM